MKIFTWFKIYFLLLSLEKNALAHENLEALPLSFIRVYANGFLKLTTLVTLVQPKCVCTMKTRIKSSTAVGEVSIKIQMVSIVHNLYNGSTKGKAFPLTV